MSDVNQICIKASKREEATAPPSDPEDRLVRAAEKAGFWRDNSFKTSRWSYLQSKG